MPDLSFHVSGVEVPPFAASPQLHFKLDVTNADASEPIHTVILQCQIHIESVRRSYSAGEKEKLRDLFGDPERWGQTLRTKLWTHAQTNISGFTGSTTATLPVPCTYDLNVVGTKYLFALDSGDAPLNFLFSGTVFYEAEDGQLQVARIAWDKESAFRLPVQVWKDMIDCYYPNTNWLMLHRDTLERLYAFKQRESLPTWEQTFERLLEAQQLLSEREHPS